jgi:hypothetical protein
MLLCLSDGKRTDDYWVERLASDFGLAFALRKDDGTVYHVNLDGALSSCECPGFLRWSHCKHCESLTALQKAGRLPSPPCPPALPQLDALDADALADGEARLLEGF